MNLMGGRFNRQALIFSHNVIFKGVHELFEVHDGVYQTHVHLMICMNNKRLTVGV